LVNNSGLAGVGVAVRRVGELTALGKWARPIRGGLAVFCAGVRLCNGLSRLLY